MSWRLENAGAPRRVVVTKTLPGPRWLEILRAAGCEVLVSDRREVLSADEIETAIGERCDGAIGQLTERWDARLFEALRRAGGRVYSNYAVGHDNVALAEATARGIAVGNTPGVLTEATAEMATALTFAAARRVAEADAFLRAGRFQGWLPDLFLGKRLHGGVLGLIGAGRIGRAYARMMACACRMRVLYVARRPSEELEEEIARAASAARDGDPLPRAERAASLEDLLAAADVVSLHVPLTPETRHLIDARRLRIMKADAILVNTSRGPVVDEKALVEHLRAHPEFRAGLDVFEEEPRLAPGLADLPNAVIVPHIASATVWTRSGMAALAAANVAGVLLGLPAARSFDLAKVLDGPPPGFAPSILNAAELGLWAA